MTQHDFVPGPGERVGGEGAAGDRRHAENAEEVVGDQLPEHEFGIAAAGQRKSGAGVARHPVE